MSRSVVRKSMEVLAALVAISYVLTISSAFDTINATQFIKDGDTIVSSGGSFELGFFGLGNSKYRYVGIRYNKISVKTVVWVANRKISLNDTSGILKVNNSGFLNVVTSTNDIIWASSSNSRRVQNPVAQILESGNLVIRELNDENPENFLWQSFDYPTDTLLPGMKLGINFVTGLERNLSSWKSSDDPAPGEFTYHLDPTGYPQIILKKGLIETYRTGPWNGLKFSGRPTFRNNSIYTHKLVLNKEEVYYMFELINPSVLSRFVLNQSGIAERLTWVERTQNWGTFFTAPTDHCDTYKLCGVYGSCNMNNGPVCNCLDRFEAKNADDWAKAYWSNGCVRMKPLDCNKGDGFRKYSHVKLPDTRSSWFNDSMTLEECENECLKKCSCMAYASLNINGSESGCLQWIGDLIDIKEIPEGGQDCYVRVAISESDMKLKVSRSGSHGKKGKTIVMSLSLLVGTVLLGLSLAVFVWKKKKNLLLKREGIYGHNSGQDNGIESHEQKEGVELPLFRLSTIAHATNYFSINNKLGQGGFGPVFKGVLKNGQEIAVKQLSKTSTQGRDEFMNELKCIVKLQHRNLVRLLGYCVQGDEKMLIYEYMSNKSLDLYIFDETRSTLLDWPWRLHIIDGIARGILYLHQDSRLRIIHRDLKASNILLDSDMNPKISDFGMARSFTKNETGANTNRVVGTYGYMSPEYVVDGLFSVKSDVFSFGVLVLEIVSGDRNREFIHRDHSHNLVGHAWRLHQEGRSLELVHAHAHAHISESRYMSEVVRSIHIGLLCAQQSPGDRPNMSTVVMMLGSEGALPQPKQPGFFTERNIVERREYFSVARATEDTTSTLLQGR